jgi:hypothetical protein
MVIVTTLIAPPWLKLALARQDGDGAKTVNPP